MSNQIQIKRSTTNANPVGLSNGELAFTSNGNVLFIGSPNGSVVAIGGLRVPGFLTANQALVSNSSGFLDEVRVANLVATKLYANGVFGANGQVVTSNSTGGLFWNTPLPGVVGANTEVQFNDSGALGANSNFTFNKTTSTLTTINIESNSVNASVYSVGANFIANSSSLTVATGAFVANQIGTFVQGVVNAAVVSVGTSFVANTSRVIIGSNVAFQANGTTGTNTQALLSNGSSVYWSDTVSSVATGNGLFGGTITTTGTLSVVANNGIVVNAGGLFVNPGTGVTVNATGVHIGQPVGLADSVIFDKITATGNVILGNNTSDNISFLGRSNTDFVPAANITFDLGKVNDRWSYVWAANVHASRGYIEGNLEVGGDLFISGNLVTVNVSSVIVSDPLIFLAANNSNSDLVDIGFVGGYYDGVTGRHAGVIRHAASDSFYVFKNYTPNPNTNVIDVNEPSFKLATTYLYLDSGGLTTGNNNVTITANATVNVAIVANSITISSPLVGTSGGTGINSLTNNSILVANSSNGYNQLSLGTNGFVLQSNGTALIYDVLDGGTF